MKITQRELKKKLDYCPKSGIFTWIQAPRGSRGKGCLAGHVDSSHGYVTIRINKEKYYAHRLAWLYMYGVVPEEIDHINHDRQDNSITNLRNGTHQDNVNNRLYSNQSGIVGITRDNERNTWVASTTINGKTKRLGRFASIDEAYKELIDNGVTPRRSACIDGLQ